MKKENKFFSFVSKFNIIPKLVCIILAFIFWIYVMEIDSPDYEDTFEDISITVLGTTELENEKNLSIFSGYDTLVDVTVKGQKSVIAKYSEEDITVTVDVSNIEKSGTYPLELYFDLPAGIDLVESSVSEVNMYIDRRTTTNVSVEPVLKSYKISASEFTLGTVSCDTDIISVTGPESILNEIDKGVVEVNMGDEHLTHSITTDGTIVLKNQNGESIESRFIKLSKNTVSVTIPVYGFKDIPLSVSTKYGFYNKDTASISVDPKTIKVKGEPAALQNIDVIDITTIDEKKISESTDLIVDISLPENVYAVDGEPTDATVSINLKNLVKKTFIVDKKNINVINAGDQKVEILDDSVAITLMCEKSIANKIKSDDIIITVDFTNFKDSTGVVYASSTITVNVEKGIAYELGFYSIQVRTVQ